MKSSVLSSADYKNAPGVVEVPYVMAGTQTLPLGNGEASECTYLGYYMPPGAGSANLPAP